MNKIKFSNYYYIFIIVYLVFSFLTFLLSANIFVFRAFTIKSNSMNPTLNKGSIIITKELFKYSPGDIITYYFKSNGREEIVTHRIVQLGGNVYVTKGDASIAIDRELVIPRLIIGKVVLIYPFLGYLVGFAKTTVGVWLMIIFPALIIISVEILKIIKLSSSVEK